MIYILILLFIIIIIVGFFLSAAILFWIAKLFKVANFSFKNSLKVTLWTAILGFIINIIFSIINLGIISTILIIVATFFVFYYFLKKYQVNWKKSLGIYISLGIITTIISSAVIIPVRLTVIQPFYVKNAGMEPNLNNNDYLIINMMNKNFSRGDIVVFKYPKDERLYLIKRIIGVPGDKLEIRDKKVFINGNALSENYLTENIPTNLPNNAFNNLTLGSNEYYLLGDEREQSFDSRIFGPIEKSFIIGKVWFRGYPKFGEIK